ncbi:hypothetical protein VT84_23505 [Gemmata sp. SH-PL17]|nr:hypothetical protein VT84_23505 [Gemmata sp. SH-PL17]
MRVGRLGVGRDRADTLLFGVQFHKPPRHPAPPATTARTVPLLALARGGRLSNVAQCVDEVYHRHVLSEPACPDRPVVRLTVTHTNFRGHTANGANGGFDSRGR